MEDDFLAWGLEPPAVSLPPLRALVPCVTALPVLLFPVWDFGGTLRLPAKGPVSFKGLACIFFLPEGLPDLRFV